MMAPLCRVEGRAYPWGAKNIDTDVIISSDYLKTTTRKELGKGAFESLRADPANIFDDSRYAGSHILIAGDNFGCGSSREHAAWALGDIGIRVVIAPSFSDIFSGNAVKNGILPVVLPQAAVDRLIAVAQDHPISVDLQNGTVTTPFRDRFIFAIDPFRRQCLLEGLDEIGVTMTMTDAIDRYEATVSRQRGWSAPAGA